VRKEMEVVGIEKVRTFPPRICAALTHASPNATLRRNGILACIDILRFSSRRQWCETLRHLGLQVAGPQRPSRPNREYDEDDLLVRIGYDG
jgi:hypothetical protein